MKPECSHFVGILGGAEQNREDWQVLFCTHGEAEIRRDNDGQIKLFIERNTPDHTAVGVIQNMPATCRYIRVYLRHFGLRCNIEFRDTLMISLFEAIEPLLIAGDDNPIRKLLGSRDLPARGCGRDILRILRERVAPILGLDTTGPRYLTLNRKDKSSK